MRTSPLPIILIFIALFTLSHADTLSISLTSYGINAAGVTYTFALSSGAGNFRTVAKGTAFTITFPSDYSSIFPDTITCDDGSSVLTCTRTDNVVTITDYFSTAKTDVLFSVRLKGLNNPTHTSTTGSFTATIPTASTTSGSTVQVSATSTVSITAGTSTCSITPASYVTGATTTMRFSITTSNAIPASGGLEIAPVQRWTFQTDYLLASSSDGFSCNITSPTSATFLNCYVSSNKLQIRSMTSTAIAAGSVLSISISGMRNPPMTTAYSYTVSTLDTSNLAIDTCSPTVTPTTANALTVDSSSFIYCTTGSNLKVVNTYETCLLTFTTTNPLPSGSNVDITFPSVVGLTTLTTVLNGATNLDFSRSSGSSLVSISSVVSTYTTATAISLRFTTIRHPGTTEPTASFKISTSYSGFSIDTITSGATYSASAGSLSSLDISSSPTTAGSTSASMTFSFIISNALTTSATLAMTFPSTITVSDATSASCSGSGTKIASTPSCAILSSVLTVSSFASSSLSTGDTVTVTLNNAVTLPASTRPTAVFTVQTKDGGYAVDQSTTATFTATAAAIVTRSVSVASGGIVGGVSTYTFTFTNVNPIPSTGKIQVAFPTDNSFAVSDSTTMAQGVQVTVGTGSATTVTSTVDTTSTPNTVTFANPTGAAIVAGTSIVFSVPSVRNPLSTASTSSFTLSTLTSGGYVIDTTSTGLALVANSVTAADFYSVNVVLSPSTTGSSSTYKFKVIPSIAQASTNKVLITFPSSSFTFSGSVSCQFVAPINKTASTCTPSSNVFTLTFNQAVDALEEFEVDIIGVSNPIASTSYSGFAISTQLSSGAQVHSRSSGISVSVTASTITTASLSPSTKALSTAATYTFTFTPINSYPSGAFIQMTVPVELTLQSSPVCTGISGISTSLPCAITDGTTNVITLNGTGSYSSSSIQFSIASIVNQASQVDSSSFVIYVKTSAGLVIDQLTSGLIAQSPCNSNCLSCSSSNRDQCLTCPTTGNTLLNVPTSTCVSTCGPGTYLNSAGTQCLACSTSAHCSECSGTASTCTACDTSSTYAYLNNSKCLSSCPNGYYADPTSKVCDQCDSPCKTCSGSSTSCLSCESNTYLQNSACKTTCSEGYYPDSSTWECASCPSNCLTCDSLSVCTACSSSGSYPILYENQCLSSCPDGTYRSGSTCAACVSPCTTCSVSASTCLTCISGLYPDNGECKSCSSSCATCSGSPTSCASCNQGYYLQGSTCVTQCSDGYYLDAGTSSCKACSTNCLTCSSLNKCTSCDTSSNYPYLYLSTSSCVSSCPSEVSAVENGVCVKSDYVAFVNPYSGLYLSGLPFPFIIFGAIGCGLVGVGKIISSNTIVTSNIIGFLGLIEFSAWIAMVILLPLSHPGDPISDMIGFPIIIVAIATLLILNGFFYYRLIRPQVKSEQFLNWKKQKKSHKISAIVIQTLSLICFKAFRLLYSRFFGLEFMSVELTEPKVFLKRLHKYTGINFVISVLPALIAAIITLNQDADDYEQLLRISVEVLVISLILMVLSIYDGFKANELEKNAENTGITAIMHGQVLEMLEKTIMDKLNESIDSKRRPQSKLNAYRRRNSLNLDQSYEYNEANSSFLNLNRTEKNLTGVGKHEESFTDSVDGVVGRDAQGNAIRAVKAIEEIEKDDDDEPTLNMKNKTLGQVRDMLKGRGHDLQPEKIMIENKDGSVIVLRDKSSYLQNNMNMGKSSPSKSQVSSIRGIDEEAGRTRMSKFVSEDEELTKPLTGRKQGHPQDRGVELDENGQPKNGTSPSKRNDSHHIIATGGSQKTGVLYDSEEELELHDSYGNLEAKLGKTSSNLENLDRRLENLSPIAGGVGMIGSRGIDNTPDRTIQKDLEDDQEEEELEVQSQTPSKTNPRQSAEDNLRSSPGFAGKPPTGRKGNKSSAKKNANSSGLKDSKEGENNGFEYVSSDSQLSVEDVHDHFQDDTPSNYDALNQRFDENLYQQQLGNMGKRPDSRATNVSNAQNMSTRSIPKTQLPPVNEVKESHRAPVYMHNYISDGMEDGDLPPVRGRSIESVQSQNNNNNSVLQRNKNKVVPFAPSSERSNSMGKRAMTPQHNINSRTAQTNSSRGFDTGNHSNSFSKSSRQELNKTVKNFHRAANERENPHKKVGSKVFDSQRDGRSSSRERPGSVDKMKRLEGIYANKVIVPRLNRINSRSSNKVANSRGFIDDEIDNDGLELHDFGKFENIVNGMKKQTSSRALDDSHQH